MVDMVPGPLRVPLKLKFRFPPLPKEASAPETTWKPALPILTVPKQLKSIPLPFRIIISVDDGDSEASASTVVWSMDMEVEVVTL